MMKLFLERDTDLNKFKPNCQISDFICTEMGFECLDVKIVNNLKMLGFDIVEGEEELLDPFLIET